MTWQEMTEKLVAMLNDVPFDEVAAIYNMAAEYANEPAIDCIHGEEGYGDGWVEVGPS